MLKLIAFPIDNVLCKVWCPHCAKWHFHGYGKEERKKWMHRVSHCADIDASGYLIKLASKTEISALSTGRCSYCNDTGKMLCFSEQAWETVRT